MVRCILTELMQCKVHKNAHEKQLKNSYDGPMHSYRVNAMQSS